MTKVLDPYKVLGVAPGASMPAIKKAGRVELKKCHPDLVPASGGVASSRFYEIVEAIAILSDPHLRAEHDRLLAEQRKAAKAAAPPKQPEPPPSRGVAMARAGIAIVQLAYLGGLALLLLLIAILVTYQIATGN